MDRLHSPWRSQFIDTASDRSEDESPFAIAWQHPERDRENMLLHRGVRAFIILNRYPYNAGHLLVLPVRMVGHLLDLEEAERHEMVDLLDVGTRILKRALAPEGFNIGMNLGRTAGAGIESHVHFHIVPRWNGDTNFMPVLDETRVISHGMEETYEKLLRARDELLG